MTISKRSRALVALSLLSVAAGGAMTQGMTVFSDRDSKTIPVDVVR